MATWPAAIRFPDGTTKYARYSTVVEAVLSGFYSDALLTEPDPPVVADFAPVADLVPVTVTVAPDDRTWHAVVDPARNELVGPRSASIGYDLQERFELARDADGVRHLRARKDVALCGRSAQGPALPFHRPWSLDGSGPEVPDVDLFASWAGGAVCRDCLLTGLPSSIHRHGRQGDHD
ncbi:hypothetical protein [Actinoplanes sp. NPDC051411]|uniref:hypothetical protein n=1 Tax=Actinoplanes sp. NPDC051411 TaxID=3155522 RepID=UPI00341D0143